LGAALRYAAGVGIARGGARARSLAAQARERLARIDRVRILDRGSSLAAIVSLAIEGVPMAGLSRQLRERGINTGMSLREYALIDMDAKHAAESLRVSPHYFNTDDELEELALALEEMVSGEPSRI
jgi:selenocysteine lyase/cysteine desulfurase